MYLILLTLSCVILRNSLKHFFGKQVIHSSNTPLWHGSNLMLPAKFDGKKFEKKLAAKNVKRKTKFVDVDLLKKSPNVRPFSIHTNLGEGGFTLTWALAEGDKQPDRHNSQSMYGMFEVKWSMSLLTPLTIRVRITLKSTIFSVKLLLKRTKINKKRPGFAPFYRKTIYVVCNIKIYF